MLRQFLEDAGKVFVALYSKQVVMESYVVAQANSQQLLMVTFSYFLVTYSYFDEFILPILSGDRHNQ